MKLYVISSANSMKLVGPEAFHSSFNDD